MSIELVVVAVAYFLGMVHFARTFTHAKRTMHDAGSATPGKAATEAHEKFYSMLFLLIIWGGTGVVCCGLYFFY